MGGRERRRKRASNGVREREKRREGKEEKEEEKGGERGGEGEKANDRPRSKVNVHVEPPSCAQGQTGARGDMMTKKPIHGRNTSPGDSYGALRRDGGCLSLDPISHVIRVCSTEKKKKKKLPKK